MSSETYYSLQIIRVVNIPKKAKTSALLIEIEFDKGVQKTVYLDGEGRPKRNDTLSFSRSDIRADAFTIRLKNSFALIGDTTVDAEELPQGSTEKDLRQDLYSVKGSLFGRRYLRKAGIAILRLKSIDAETRAEIEVDIAKQSVRHIEDLVRRTEDRDEVIGAFVGVADGIIAIVDDIAEIHPIFNISWKAVSLLYKLVNRQMQNDTQLTEMVEEMRTVFDFSKEAKKLNDDTKRLKPVVKKLLSETAECACFVQEYANHNFPRRMGQIDSARKINKYSKEFAKLRKDLDTAIGMNTNKDVQDIKLLQQLDGLLLPVKSDPSAMLRRPRCLEGTRQEYLDPILEFLSDKRLPSMLWLTGIAGSGKSTIAVTTSDRCRDKFYSPVYMFFEREKSNPSSVIRTIASAIASEHPTTIGQRILGVLEKTRSIRDASLGDQFEALLRKPLDAVAAEVTGPIVIILDAFDECGSAEQRRDLLQLLTAGFADLPPKVRVLVTSRPEEDILENLRCTDRIRHEVLKHDSGESRRDVGHYIRYETTEAVGTTELKGKGWDDKLQVLCDAADGLFIWASTAMKMIDGPPKLRQRRLETLIKNIQTVGGGLDSLYGTVLKESGVWREDDPELRDAGTAILGFILVSKEAATVSVIAALLDLGEDTVDAALSQLRSVILYEPGKPVRLHHASFADYLSSLSRGRPWHVDKMKYKQIITEGCFDIMARYLCFNICEIESSFQYNSEVRGLKGRIAVKIPSHLSFACRSLSVHMCELEARDDTDEAQRVRKKLESFAKEQLLYWLEALSLTECFNRIAGRALREASSWVSLADEEISTFLLTAYNLVTIFAIPISQNVPHIYLSTISLSKGESPIADHYSGTHPVVNVRAMGTRAPSRCIKVLEGSNNVVSLAVSTDGRFIASGSVDRMIRIWDIDNREAPPSEFEVDELGTVAFSPDDEYLVSCSGKGTVCTWEVGSGKCVSRLNMPGIGLPGGLRTSVAYSSDGKRVVSVCDGRVCNFDVDGGRLQLVPGFFKDDTNVRFRAVSTNGKYVAGTKNGMIAIWDSGNGEQIFNADIDMPGSITVSPDGKRVVDGYLYQICIWSVDSGNLVEKSVGRVISAAFSCDGKRIVAGSRSEIVILDADSGDMIWGPIKECTAVMSVAFTPDGKRAISGSFDGTVRIWDVGSGEVSSGSSDAHTDSVLSVAFSPDGKRIVSGSEDSTIRVWNSETGRLIAGPFEGHTHTVDSVAFSPDGKRVVAASFDYTIRIWDVDSGKLALSLSRYIRAGFVRLHSLPTANTSCPVRATRPSVFGMQAAVTLLRDLSRGSQRTSAPPRSQRVARAYFLGR